MRALAALLLMLPLAACGTSLSVSYPTEHGAFEAHLLDFKDREAFQAGLQRDPATGMITGLEITSAQTLTSPTAAANADAIATLAGTVADLAEAAAGVPAP